MSKISEGPKKSVETWIGWGVPKDRCPIDMDDKAANYLLKTPGGFN